MRIGSTFAFAASCLLAQTAVAQTTTVDLSGSTNFSLQNGGYIAGTSYPGAGANLSINGVPFVLSSFNGGPDAGTIQTGFGKPSSIVVSLPGTTGVSRVYTLANTAGLGSPVVGNFTFNFSSGRSFVYTLGQGQNIRDHLGATGEPVPSQAFGTKTFGTGASTVYLDAQAIDLPSSFRRDVLQSMTINDQGGDANPFVAAMSLVQSVTAVPEPGTWAMMIIGFGGIGTSLRRRSKRAVSPAIA